MMDRKNLETTAVIITAIVFLDISVHKLETSENVCLRFTNAQS